MQLSWKLCSSPCRLPRAGTALEEQPWVQECGWFGSQARSVYLQINLSTLLLF